MVHLLEVIDVYNVLFLIDYYIRILAIQDEFIHKYSCSNNRITITAAAIL